jgi:hypothetical protein
MRIRNISKPAILVIATVGIGLALAAWKSNSLAGAAEAAANQPEPVESVSSALAQELPPALKGLAPTAAGALRQPATDAVDRLLDAPHVQQLFLDASSLAPRKPASKPIKKLASLM